MSWLREYPVEELAVTAVSIAEISYGLNRLARGRRRDSLQWRFQMFIAQGFSDRIFPIVFFLLMIGLQGFMQILLLIDNNKENRLK